MEVNGFGLLFLVSVAALAPSTAGAQGMRPPSPPQQPRPEEPVDQPDRQAQQHLAEGIRLTRAGEFSQAIPNFLAARGKARDTFALEFNLALCYVGTRQFQPAIAILAHIRGAGKHAADVDNLLAQAYIGNHEDAPALQAIEAAAALAPSDQRLYLLTAEACLDEGLTELGLHVIGIGLTNLPNAPRLLFERALLRSRMDRTELAAQDFRLVVQLAPGSDVADIASAQQALLAGDIPAVIRVTRKAIAAGRSHYLLLTMLGEALLRSGVTPASAADFAEAQNALERAVELRPTYSGAHVSLARVYLLNGRVDDAIGHLEAARRLAPGDRAIYPALASAYRKAGRMEQAKEVLAALSELNRQDVEKIRAAPDHAGYVGH